MKKEFVGYVENNKYFYNNALYNVVDIDKVPLDKSHYKDPQKYRLTVIVEKWKRKHKRLNIEREDFI